MATKTAPQVQITIDRDIYETLQTLMVPPNNDANAVIKELLFLDGHASPASVALGAAERHFTMEQELERNRQGVYDHGGGT